MKFMTLCCFTLLAALSANIAEAHPCDIPADSKIGESGGIGVLIYADEFGLRIDDVLEGGPAASSGVEPGDYIWAIDGKAAHDWNVEQAGAAIRGEVGSTVLLTIRRGDVELTVSIVRDWIYRP